MLHFVPVSTAVGIDTNLANGQTWQKSDRDRVIRRIGLIGGAAKCDAEVDVFHGTEQQMHLINFQTNTENLNDKLLWNTSPIYCKANTPINIYVTKAFSGTLTYLVLDIKNTSRRRS